MITYACGLETCAWTSETRDEARLHGREPGHIVLVYVVPAEMTKAPPAEAGGAYADEP